MRRLMKWMIRGVLALAALGALALGLLIAETGMWRPLVVAFFYETSPDQADFQTLAQHYSWLNRHEVEAPEEWVARQSPWLLRPEFTAEGAPLPFGAPRGARYTLFGLEHAANGILVVHDGDRVFANFDLRG